MNNYRERILEILEDEFLEGILNSYFENDKITNKTFSISSSLLKGKFDPMYFTGMNVVIDDLVRKFRSFSEQNIRVLGGEPFKSKFFGLGDYRLIRIRDIKRNYINIDNAEVIPESQFLSFPSAMAQLNDVLIGLDGDEFRAAIIRQEHLPCSINQRIAIIRGLPEDLAIYFMLAINSYIGVYQLERVKTFAGTVGHISVDDIKNLRFPLDENYANFVHRYKETISGIGISVADIQKKSDELRLQIYSRLDLHPTKDIREFIKL
jgi:hypothetical protein